MNTPVSVNAVQQLHDIRGPVAIPGEWLWIAVLLGVLALAAAVIAVVRLFKRKKIAPAVISRPAWQIALEKLAAVEGGGYIARGLVKEYYSDVSDILRWYIEERFAVRSPEMTTEEFMDAVRHSEKLTSGQQKFLIDFLNASDMVKFAKFIPLPEQMREALKLARAFVEEAR